MCKLTKHLPIQGGCWIFRIQAEDFTRGGYKFRGGGGCLKTPVGAMSKYSLLIIALYLAAKFINFPGKFII